MQPLAVNVARARDGVVMTRRWSAIIFPSANGTMTIPPLVAHLFNTSSARREELRCTATTLEVQEASAPAAAAPSTRSAVRSAQSYVPWIVAIVLTIVVIAILIKPIRHEIATRREVQGVMRSGNIREAIDAMVDPRTIANEASDRGDAYRALRSLLDALDRDRALEGDADVERRVRDLVQSLR